MGEDFWVDTDGMRRSANGFSGAADRIKAIIVRLHERSSGIGNVFGSGPESVEFEQKFREGADAFDDAVDAWSKAVRGTGDGVTGMADLFDETERSNTDAAGRLNAGSGLGGADPDVPPVNAPPGSGAASSAGDGSGGTGSGRH